MQIYSDKNNFQTGFTLIEVLVVMLIIGLALSGLSRLNYSTGPQQLQNQVREFAGTTELMLEEAVLSGNIWGVDFYTDENNNFGFRWLQLEDNVWGTGLPAGMDDFNSTGILVEGVVVELKIEGMDISPEKMANLEQIEQSAINFAPEVWLYPDHETTAFRAEFNHEEFGGYVVTSDILGRIEMQTY